ncbi:Protein of unknown function [Gryllus bimaculatus]|nr:Protein of unknown function [Gryllus bimaculatus]
MDVKAPSALGLYRRTVYATRQCVALATYAAIHKHNQPIHRNTRMKCVALCALALAAWACVGVRAQGDDPERRVSCLPCRDGDPAARNCTAVRPEHYRSGRLTWCGCCDTCLVYIVDGQFCVGAIPTNGVCNPPMQCEGNVCRNS